MWETGIHELHHKVDIAEIVKSWLWAESIQEGYDLEEKQRLRDHFTGDPKIELHASTQTLVDKESDETRPIGALVDT